MAKPPPHPMPKEPRIDSKDRDYWARMMFNDYFGNNFSLSLSSEVQYSSLYQYYSRLKWIKDELGIVYHDNLDEMHDALVDKALIGKVRQYRLSDMYEISLLGKKFMEEFEEIPL